MFSLAVSENLFTSSVSANASEILRTLANNVLVSFFGVFLFVSIM